MPAKDKLTSAQSADEWFDVVDAEDRVIGQATRGEVHARGLWHRAIHVLVFNAAGHVFLQQRSLLKDSAPGKWCASCSGHLDAGESYDEAAYRELQEEIGLHLPQPPTRWFRLSASEDTGWEFIWIFRAVSEGPFTLHPAEIQNGAWYEPAALTAAMQARPQDFTRPFRLVWQTAVGKEIFDF